MVVCRQDDDFILQAAAHFNDEDTALCTKIERDFLRTLLGGCSTPISALAQTAGDSINFIGNIVAPDGSVKAEMAMALPRNESKDLGIKAAQAVLEKGGKVITDSIRNAGA
jgi:hydroxymethylbilane synthase